MGDFNIDVTTLYNAIVVVKTVGTEVEELSTVMSGVSIDVKNKLISDYLENAKINARIIITEVVNPLKLKLDNIKNTLCEMDSSAELLFLSLSEDFSDDFGNILDDFGEYTDEQKEELLYAFISRAGQQEETFELVKEYEVVLAEYTAVLKKYGDKIAALEAAKAKELSEYTGNVYDAEAYDKWMAEVVAKYDKQIAAVQGEYNTLSEALSLLSTAKDYAEDYAFKLYQEEPGFKGKTEDGMQNQIASHEFVYNESSYAAGDGYYIFYDKDGNVIENISQTEKDLYLNRYNHMFEYLEEEEKKIAAYLLNTGNLEKLDQYLELKEEHAAQREASDQVKDIMEKIEQIEKNASNEIEADIDTLKVLASEGFINGLETFFDGLYNLTGADGKMSHLDYKTAFLVNELNEKYSDEKLMQLFTTSSYEISTSLGNMVPSMAIGLLIPGGVTFMGTKITVGSIVGSTIMGASAAGNAREQALQKGMSEEQAWMYGTIIGTSETVLGNILGAIPGLSQFDKFTKLPGWKGFVAKLGSEGLEESTQSIVEALTSAAITKEQVEINWEEVAKSGIYGIITAGLTNGGGMVINGTKYMLTEISTSDIKNLTQKYELLDMTDQNVKQQLANDLEQLSQKNATKNATLSKESSKSSGLTLFNTSDTKASETVSSKNQSTDQNQKQTNNTTTNTNNTQKTNQTERNWSGEIGKINYETAKGHFYTIKVNSLSEIPSNLWSQIDDPSLVNFDVNGEKISYVNAKTANMPRWNEALQREQEAYRNKFKTKKPVTSTSTQSEIIQITDINDINADFISSIKNTDSAKFQLPDGQVVSLKAVYDIFNNNIKENSNIQQNNEQINLEQDESLVDSSIYTPEAVPRNVEYLNNLDNVKADKSLYLEDRNTLARELNISKEEAQSILDKKIKEIIQDSEVAIRADSKSILNILKNGKIKNLFETGTGKGSTDINHRAGGEDYLYGISEDTNIKDRPIYGLAMPKLDTTNSDVLEFYRNQGSHYGDVIIMLNKDKIVNNSTFTCGDSLEYNQQVAVSDYSNPTYNGSPFRHIFSNIDFSNPSNFQEQWSNVSLLNTFRDNAKSYLEVQVHGEANHTTDIIDKIIFPQEPSWQIKRQLDKAGINWEVLPTEPTYNQSELTNEIASIKENTKDLFNASTATTMLNLKKTLLGFLTALPSTVNKFRSDNLSSNSLLFNQCLEEGLYHITSESAAQKILETGYVKASGNPVTSYGSKKAFFFSGVPGFGEVCSNVNFLEKTTAIKIKPTAEQLNSNNFKYRSHDDFTISHDGDFYFNNQNAEIVYLGLAVNDNGEFYYKEISKDEYETYVPNTDSITRNSPKIVKNLANDLKTMLFGLAYQYDTLAGNVNKLNQLAGRDLLLIEKYNASSDIYTPIKYGGNQSDVVELIDSYLLNYKFLSSMDIAKAELLNNLIDKYFPNSTNIQKVNLATHYANGGCCWMAVANAFATYIGSLEDGATIFKNKIGFDLTMTDGQNTSYNLEAIAFDMYLDYYSKVYNGSVDQLLNSNDPAGVSANLFDTRITSYFTNRGINIQSDTEITLAGKNLNNKLLKRILNNKDGFNILSANNFDMKLIDQTENVKDNLDEALANSNNDGDIVRNVGPHAMLVTGIDENMNLIVSSWNKKYQFLSDSISEYKSIGQDSNASIWTIKFSIPSTNNTVDTINNNISGSSNTKMGSIFSKSSDNIRQNNQQTTEEIINNVKDVIAIMDAKNKSDPRNCNPGVPAIERYLKTGESQFITRDNNCREYIRSIPKEYLSQALDYIKNSEVNNQQNFERIVNNKPQFIVRNTVSELNETAKNPVQSYGNLSKIEKAINKGGSAYSNLVSINSNTPKTKPTHQKILEFYNRFASNKYNIRNQKNAFSHIYTNDFNTGSVTKKLYINIQDFNDTIDFGMSFAKKCEERGLPFYFKTTYMQDGTDLIKPFQLVRDESIVIYANDINVAEYVNICNEIKRETNMQFLQPPILSGIIDGFIGYGAEFKNHKQSYNSTRSDLISNAVNYANNLLINQYRNNDIESILNYIRQNNQSYKQYLNTIYNYINSNAAQYGIDVQKFFLNYE